MRLEITEIPAVLGKNELIRFGKFIRSPFFNSEPRFLKLYDYITSGSKEITRETIAAEMFGKGTTTLDERFRKLISEFMKLFERYLSELEFEKDIYRQKLGSAEQFYKLGMAEKALQVLEKPIEELEKKPMKEESLLNRLLEMYALKYSISGQNFNNFKNDLSFRINDILDEYFVTFKSFLFSRFISFEKVFNIEKNFDKSFEHCLNEYAGSEKSKLSPTNSDAYLRYKTYEMFKDPDSTEILNEFLISLEKAEKTAPGQCKALYSDLLNQYTILVNFGNPEYEIKIIEIGRLMENKGYFRDRITYIETAIIVEACIGTGEYDWALGFIQRIKNKITEINSQNIYFAYAAKIYFFKKDYNNARIFINKVEIDDYFRYSESKLLECRILYDEMFVSELLLAIDKIGKFLKSHKEIGSHYRKSYLLFLDALKTLTRLREKKEQGKEVSYEISKLRKDIQTHSVPIYAQTWLIEKITETEKAG